MAQGLDTLFVEDISEGFETSFRKNIPLVVENAPFNDYSHPNGKGVFKRNMSSMFDEALKLFSSSRMMGVVDVACEEKQTATIRGRKYLGVYRLSMEAVKSQEQDIKTSLIAKLSDYPQGLIVLDVEGDIGANALNAIFGVVEKRELNGCAIPSHVQFCLVMEKKDIELGGVFLKNRAHIVTNKHKNFEHTTQTIAPSGGNLGHIDDEHYNKVASAGYGWLNRLLVNREQKGQDNPSYPTQPLFK